MTDHIDTREDDQLSDDEFAQRIEREREDGQPRPLAGAGETPTFEQSDKPVRLGSEVLLVYPAGDCDVAMVTGIERGDQARGVWVQVPNQLAQLVDVGALAPYESEDMDPIWAEDEVKRAAEDVEFRARTAAREAANETLVLMAGASTEGLPASSLLAQIAREELARRERSGRRSGRSVWIDGTGTTTVKDGGRVVSITGPDGQPKDANKYGEVAPIADIDGQTLDSDEQITNPSYDAFWD